MNIRVGRNEEAIKVLKDALEIDSKYAEAYRLIGVAQLQLKQNKEACASFAKAKELGDPNVDALIENTVSDSIADDIFIKKALLSQAEPLSGNSRVKKELAKSRF